ncbi:hypothetical protein N9C31_01445 [Gammaproteobacteria bacterium]|nr:hypothetical protein [Gammaproteobacteria bacterium]
MAAGCIPVVNCLAQAVFYSPSSSNQGRKGYFYDETASGGLKLTASLGSFAGLIQNLIIFSGICMLFVALNKYFEHRKNPQYAPLSNVFSALLIAAALLVLGLVTSGAL